MTIEFECLPENMFYISGRGKAYTVRNPKKCVNFNHLVDQEIIMNGDRRIVVGIEKFAHHPPWVEGEIISLVLRDKN